MITYRLATKKDRTLFAQLWKEFLEEEYADGGDLPPTKHNVMEAMSLMYGYADGYYRGACCLAEDDGEAVAIALAGESPGGGLQFEYRNSDKGRTATVWGVYVKPSHRQKNIGHEILNWGRTTDNMKCFKYYTSSVRNRELPLINATHYGANVVSVIISWEDPDVKEKDNG